MIRRREFITLLGGTAAAWPLAAKAQQPERMRLVGVLSNIPEDDAAMKARFAGFRQELERLGWLQSRNVHIETRFGAVTPEQIRASAKVLVALQPDVILANAPHVARELQQASRTIPIVFAAVSDPIGAGLMPVWRGREAISRASKTMRQPLLGSGLRCSRRLRPPFSAPRS
jgi:ABC-type uncharacterized transport system substrate-binding protein